MVANQIAKRRAILVNVDMAFDLLACLFICACGLRAVFSFLATLWQAFLLAIWQQCNSTLVYHEAWSLGFGKTFVFVYVYNDCNLFYRLWLPM